jgi:hypothetical protein
MDGTMWSWDAAATYQIRVRGELDPRWTAWFAGLTITHADGETTLTGVVADQAMLYGLISRARDLGLVLIAVVRTEPEGEPRDARPAR